MFYASAALYEKLDDCDNENKQKPFDCANELVAELSGCMAHTYGLNTSGFHKCTTLEEYRKFFKTAFQMYMGRHTKTLNERKCAVKNCNTYSWSSHRATGSGAKLSQISMIDKEVSSMWYVNIFQIF